MCGICGKYSPLGVSEDEIGAMLSAIIHRGPDDEGSYIQGPVGIGNRRLSIIDLPGGRQPIHNENQQIWVVFNGEIYNYRHLRHQLEEAGHQFYTQSDTEVIVHLYEEYGRDCVQKLQGMFAFAIWDANRHELLLARDHLGQKPLFYSLHNGEFLFGSEIKSILAASKRPRELNTEALSHYLSLRFVPSPDTMLKGIHKLPPGHWLAFDGQQMVIEQYWHLSFNEKIKRTEVDYLCSMSERLVQTVKEQLISDVPVGAFLSGGMDSSMVVAIMAQDLNQSFDTFAVGVHESSFNEIPFARSVAKHHQTSHHEIYVKSNLIESLPEMIWHLDEPSDPIAACQYQAAKLASQHVKVVLGGDGGDELFAGFDRYLGVGYASTYAMLPSMLRSRLIGPLLDAIPENFAYKSMTQKVRWLHQLAELPNVAQRYAQATCFFRFTHAEKKDLFGEALWSKLADIDSTEVLTDHYDKAPATDPIDRMLYTDYQTRLPEHSLMLTDRMTMAHGVELRSPFLDHKLVEHLASFPSTMKIHKRELKYVLRRMGESYLPHNILNRDKQGFMFPIAYWLRGPLYEFTCNFLSDSYAVEAGIFQRETVMQLLEEHRNSQVDHHVRLWMLLNVEIWLRLYILGEEKADVTARLSEYLR